MVQIQAAVRPARAAWRADHQAQHAVAPAADPGVVSFGKQIVDLVDALGVELDQRGAREVMPGVEDRQGAFAGIDPGGLPAEMLAEIAMQQRATAGVAWVEEKVLQIHRHEFQRVAQLVGIGAACLLGIVLLACAALANALWPAGQIEQARVVAEGEAALGLPAAAVRQADQAETAGALSTERLLSMDFRRPELGAVIEMSHFVNERRQHFLTHRAVRPLGALSGCAAIGECWQQAPVEQQQVASGAAIDIVGQPVMPADADVSVETLEHSRRQRGQRFVQQLLTGGAFGWLQLGTIERQAQLGLAQISEWHDKDERNAQPPGPR